MLTRISRAVAAAAACLLAALGTVVLALVSPVTLVAVLMMGLFVGAIVATHLPGAEPSAGFPSPARHRHAAGAAAAAVTVSVLLATAGTAALLGGAAAPLLLLVLAGTGAGLWRHRAAWRAYATAVTRPGAAAADARRLPAAPPIVPGTLTVPALCLAWQRSQWSLNGLPPGSARAELISARAGLLDELERRDPDGFRRWLHRGVRANADPGHYLSERPTPRPPAGAPHHHDDDRRTP